MSGEVIKPLWFPRSQYHRNFYLLRLSISINHQPLVLKSADTIPGLYSQSINQHISLSFLITQVANAINKHKLCINEVYFDGHCPLFALGFSTLLKGEQVSKILPELGNELNTNENILKLFNCSPDQVHAAVSVYLCCPHKDRGASLIPLTTSSHFEKYQESIAFDFSKLFSKSGKTGA